MLQQRSVVIERAPAHRHLHLLPRKPEETYASHKITKITLVAAAIVTKIVFHLLIRNNEITLVAAAAVFSKCNINYISFISTKQPK